MTHKQKDVSHATLVLPSPATPAIPHSTGSYLPQTHLVSAVPSTTSTPTTPALLAAVAAYPASRHWGYTPVRPATLLSISFSHPITQPASALQPTTPADPPAFPATPTQQAAFPALSLLPSFASPAIPH